VLDQIREKAERIIEPIARKFVKVGFTPNSLTCIGIAFGIIAAFLFAQGEQPLAGLALLTCGFFDVIDGAVARLAGRVTAFGGVLDSVADRYVELLIFVGIIYGGLIKVGYLPSWLWGLLALTGSLLVSYTRARAEAEGSGKLAVGIAERGERFLILAVGGLLALTGYAVVLIAILAHLTVAQRLVVARRRLRW
jgi:archaetidylinositol phosphate synthase